MDVSLYDFDYDLMRVKKKISEMKTDGRNIELLLDFAEDCLAGWKVPKISKSRVITLLQRLSKLTGAIKKEWIWCEEKDARQLLNWIDDTHPLPKGAWSQHSYRIVLRKFVTWMRKKHGYPEGYQNRENLMSVLIVAKYANEVAHFHIKEPDKLRDAQSIPTEQEMEWLSDATTNLRDKAWIEMSREHGERIGGLGTRQIKHIRFDSLGALVVMHDKTFRGEPVRYIVSNMYLRQWIDKHPFKDKPEAPLWIDMNKLPDCIALNYDGFRAIIRHLTERHNRRAEKDGKPLINKKITTHLFRYYAQTRDEKQGMPRSIMCKLRGWKPGSKQPDRYSRLSSDDVDDYLAQKHGIVSDNEKEEIDIKIIKP